jgi:8-oxo-dGTP diphosphatase
VRTYPDRPILGVGGIVFDDDRVLLVRRAHEPLRGAWTLPGGGVEVGETIAAAVVRELLEETGLAVEAGPVVEVVDRIDTDPDGRVRHHFVIVDVLCRSVGGHLSAASDAADVCWTPVSELPARGVSDLATRVIHKALVLALTTPYAKARLEG